MPTTATKLTRETWRSWMPVGAPEPDLLTKDEFIAELTEIGVSVKPRNLEEWQLHGVIPYPTRKRHKGATRALYPAWLVPAVKRLKDMLGRGRTFEDIKPWMRASPIIALIQSGDWKMLDSLEQPKAEARAAIMNYVRVWENEFPGGPKIGGVTVILDDGIGNELDYFVFPVVPEHDG